MWGGPGLHPVGLGTYRAITQAANDSLITSGQGRRINAQRCRLDPPCLSSNIGAPMCSATPELCGCPPNERCLCPRGADCADESGFCFGDDRTIDKLQNRYDMAGNDFLNEGGCQVPILDCTKPSRTQESKCSCGDSFRGNACIARDACNCKVPNKALIGVAGTTRFPYGLTAGALRSDAQADIVVATAGGIDFLEETSQGAWSWEGQPVVNDRSDVVTIADYDQDGVTDVAFISNTPCQVFGSRTDPCPIVNSTTEGTPAPGCAGIVLRAKAQQLDIKKEDGCRRYPVQFSPDGMCQGDFNGDGGIDLALSSADSDKVAIYLGDGAGGLLSPPDLVALPGGTKGGPIACGAIDGDGQDDIVTVSADGKQIIILRTQQ